MSKVINIGIKTKRNNLKKIKEKIKDCDVVIFNNVCIVALKYDNSTHSAPIVVYKSKSTNNCKLVANNLNIPMYKHNVASDIFLSVAIGKKIPSFTYVSVAEMLHKAYNKEELNFDDLLNDTKFYPSFKSKIVIEFSPNLYSFFKSHEVIEKIENTRGEIISELGLFLPLPKTIQNYELETYKYNIKINNAVIGEGKLYPDKNLKLYGENDKEKELNCIEPAFGIESAWISKDVACDSHIVVSASSVFVTHLKKIIVENAGELFTRRQVYQIFKKLDIEMEDYSYKIQNNVSIDRIQVVLTNLLKEEIPILEIEKILETMSTYNYEDVTIGELTQKVRENLSLTICNKYANQDKTINALSLSGDVEQKILSLNKCNNYSNVEFVKEFIGKLDKKLISILLECKIPVLICTPEIRNTLRKITNLASLNKIPVIAYSELNKHYKAKILGTIDV